ncbi:MAG: AAA family ATPase [Bacteroidia bacterium]
MDNDSLNPTPQSDDQQPIFPETPQPDNFASRTNLFELSQAVNDVKSQIGRIVVGQHEMVELMLAAVLSDGHILIEGVPGVAKTLSAKMLARTLDVPFSRIQFTPDLMPSDVLGTSIFNQKESDFEFHKGPIFSNLVLIDEINRAPAKTQAALFEVMEERQITMDGETYSMEPPFFVVATQNPIEQEGTYRLPEAQLDRFLFKIDVTYPGNAAEKQMLTSFHERKGLNDLSQILPVISGLKIAELQEIVRGIYIESPLIHYIVDLVEATRNSPDLYLGASPRASINLMTTSKAIAAMRGRDFVTPDDVKFVAPHLLHHRVMLTPEKEMEGGTAKQVIEALVSEMEVPR